jgi:hypothetical protein
MNGYNEVVRALVEQTIDKDSSAKKNQQAKATADAAAAAAAAMATVGAGLSPDNSYSTGVVTVNPLDSDALEGSDEDSSPAHSSTQVSQAENSTLITPLNEDITINQTLISPLISSDNASVSVDITIDGNAEEYEVYWVTV